MAKLKKNDRRIPEMVITRKNDQGEFDTIRSFETEDYTCFGITPKDNRALALKVIGNNGVVVLIQYSRMLSPISFNGKNEIKMMTPEIRIEVSGSNLAPLLDYIGEQRLAWIKSSMIDGESDAILMKTGEPEITALRLVPNEKNKT